MAITNRDAKANTVLTASERECLRSGFRHIKAGVAKACARAPVSVEWAQIISHSWELLRDADEAPERIGGIDDNGLRFSQREKLRVVRNEDGSTIVIDKDRACLRAFFAAGFSFLAKERVSIDPEAQVSLARSWDVVRNPDEPSLPFKDAAASAIVLPFGNALPIEVVASKGPREV